MTDATKSLDFIDLKLMQAAEHRELAQRIADDIAAGRVRSPDREPKRYQNQVLKNLLSCQRRIEMFPRHAINEPRGR